MRLLAKRTLLAAAALVALAASGARAQDGAEGQPAITFIKEFPGSTPAYYSITLRQQSADRYVAEYRAEPDEEPTVLPVAATVAQRAFELAETLERFGGAKIESGRKVAQMGKKTLRYDRGAERHEADFNHTELPAALELTNWFERLATTQRHADRLEYLLRFDRLGIVKELLQTEVDLNSDRLLEPKLLLPVLNKVLANKSLVNVAHDRARQLVSRLSTLP